MDAAVAVSSALALMEPCSTGLGGDMFLMYYDAKTRYVPYYYVINYIVSMSCLFMQPICTNIVNII